MIVLYSNLTIGAAVEYDGISLFKPSLWHTVQIKKLSIMWNHFFFVDIFLTKLRFWTDFVLYWPAVWACIQRLSSENSGFWTTFPPIKRFHSHLKF